MKIKANLLGDCQLLSLNCSGNGIYKTRPSSIKKLFFMKIGQCSVVSTEIKLIVDEIEKFGKCPFREHYDATYIYDTF